jgi:hypothetical protein
MVFVEQDKKEILLKHIFKPNNIVLTSTPLDLLYIDSFGPLSHAFVSWKKYGLFIVDDYNKCISGKVPQN